MSSDIPEVFSTSHGLLRGAWLKYSCFQWCQADLQGPGAGAVKSMLVSSEEDSLLTRKVLERGELVDGECLGRGSFTSVWGVGGCPWVARRVGGDQPSWVKRASVRRGYLASIMGVGPTVGGYGYSTKLIGTSAGTCALVCWLKRCGKLSVVLDYDESYLFELLYKWSLLAFHGDLKLDNLMRCPCTNRLVLIDFDLASEWSVRVVASARSFVVFDFHFFLTQVCGLRSTVSDLGLLVSHYSEGAGVPGPGELPALGQLEGHCDEDIRLFRVFYDYTTFSLSLPPGHGLYPPVLERLVFLWDKLSRVLGLLAQWMEGQGDLAYTLPFECLVRAEGVRALSVNLLDLRGNALAHGLGAVEHLPRLIESRGLYLP
jgi:hypothetical protein